MYNVQCTMYNVHYIVSTLYKLQHTYNQVPGIIMRIKNEYS